MITKKLFWLALLVIALSVVSVAQPADQAGEKIKYKETMGDMKSIGVALESYILDFGFAPKVDTFAELEKILVPYYIKTLPLVDAWGQPFIYVHGQHPIARLNDPKIKSKIGNAFQDFFFIGSGGSDGRFKGFEQEGFYTDLNGQDIILVNQALIFKMGPLMPSSHK
jgi:hypothetical protein